MKETNPHKKRPQPTSANDEIKTNKKQKSSKFVSSGSYIFTFVLLIVILLIYDVILTSHDTVDAQAVKKDLLGNVHNQTEVLSIIINILTRMFNNEQGINVVNFIGSTGVGKTFITNILKKHFHPSSFQLNGLFDKKLQHTLYGIKYASPSYRYLIVVDDLTVVDIDSLLNFLKEIPQELTALVVCVFNIQETDSDLNHTISYKHIGKIVEKFNEAGVSHKIAKFHEFDRNQASQWVIKQLVLRGVNPQLHSKIVDSVLFNQNLRYKGLKGLTSKINLEL